MDKLALESTEVSNTLLRTQFFDRQKVHTTVHIDEVRRETARHTRTVYHVIQTQTNEQHAYYEKTYAEAIRTYNDLIAKVLDDSASC